MATEITIRRLHIDATFAGFGEVNNLVKQLVDGQKTVAATCEQVVKGKLSSSAPFKCEAEVPELYT